MPGRVYHGDYKSSILCYTALTPASKTRPRSPDSENSKYKINFFIFNLQPGAVLFQPQRLQKRRQSGHWVPGTLSTWHSWLAFHSKIILYLFKPEDVPGFGDASTTFAFCLQGKRHRHTSRQASSKSNFTRSSYMLLGGKKKLKQTTTTKSFVRGKIHNCS